MKKLRNNDGYSLVEMIIVIAIIAILSGLAALTVSSISSARATAALNTFDSELSGLNTRTKSLSSDSAMLLKREGNDYKIYYGTSDDGVTFAQTSTKAEATLTRVDIYKDGSTDVLEDDVIIKFRKSDGSVISGFGSYSFCKKGSKQSIGKLVFNKTTGGHYYDN